MPLLRTSASDVTAYRRANAAQLASPTIKSASFQFVPKAVIRTIDVSKTISPTRTTLGVPIFKAPQLPRTRYLY